MCLGGKKFLKILICFPPQILHFLSTDFFHSFSYQNVVHAFFNKPLLAPLIPPSVLILLLLSVLRSASGGHVSDKLEGHELLGLGECFGV